MKTLQIKKTIFSMMLGLGLMVGTTPAAAEIIFDDFGGTPKTYSFGTAPLSTTPALLVELDLPAGKKVKIERFGYGSVNYFQILSVDVNQSLVGSFYYAASAEAGESWGNVSSDSVGNWGNITSLSTDYFTTEHLRENPTYIPFRFTDTTDGNKQKYGSVKCSTELTGSGNASVLTLKIYSYAYQTDGSEIAMGAGGSTIVKADQAIDFPAIAAQDISGSVALEASASSGLPVAFTVIDGPGNLAGTTLTFSAAGTVAVVAAQAGDGSWNAAAPVTNRVSVYTLTAFSGPAAGGNSLTITYGELGSVTTVLIGGVSAAITEQGAGWVTITMPTVVSEGTKDIVIQTTDNSDITLPGAYTVNPAGMIWNPTFIKGAPHIAGDYHSMALKADGSVAVWGRDHTGQLNVPAPNSDFVAVSAGGGYCLALKSDGTISGWGRSPDRQTAVPAPNSDFVAISAADIHSLGLKADGSVVGWGTNTLGQLIVPAPNSGFVAIAAGYSGYSLGLKADGRIVAWGRNDYNQTDVPSPNSNFVAMSAGHRHALGLKADGSVVGWGTNTLGQLTLPTSNSNFVAVAAGAVHSLGLKADGTIVSWGNNRFGQLNVPDSDLDYGLFEYGVTPSYGVYTGGYEVVISGTNLCDGTINDVSAVTLCGVTGSVARVSGSTQIVVRAGQAATIGRGDVRVVSTRFGETVKSNAFTYQRAEQAPLIFEPITPQAYRVKNELSTSGGSGTGAVSYRVISGPGTIMDGPKLYVSAGSGTIEIRATKAQDDLFYATSAIATVQAIRGAAILTLSDLTHTYDGTPKSATVTTDPQGMEVEVEFTYDGSETPPTEVGSYTVVATVDIENWIGSATGTLTIAKAAATVTLNNLAQTYDGSPKRAIAVTAPPALPVDLTYDGSETPPTEVGSYSVVATVDLTNWEGSTTGTLTITKATAVVTLGNLAQTYDGLAKSVTATTEPAGLTVDLTYDGSTDSPQAAGSYAVTGTVSAANYQGSVTGTLIVAKAPVTITLQNLVQTYDGTARIVTAQTSPSGFAVNVTYDASPMAPVHAGTYAVYAAVNEPNYAGFATNTLTIAKASQTITFPALADQLTTNVLALSATASSGFSVTNFNLVSGPAVLDGNSLSFTGSGRVTISASQAGNDNWNATAVTNNFTVERADAAFLEGPTASAITYGDALGASTLSGGMASVPGSFTFFHPTNIPSAGMTIQSVRFAPDDSAMYAGFQIGAYVTVHPRALTVSNAQVANRIYDGTTDATVSGATLVGVLDGDLVTLENASFGTFATNDVSTAIAVTTSMTLGGDDAGNYSLTQPTLSADITPKALAATADAKGKTYGVLDPVLTYTVSGLVNDETETDVLSGALSRAAGEAVGTYTITQGTLAANANYTLTYTTANLTISAAALTVAAEAKGKTYGEADPVLTYTVNGLVNDDAETDALSGALSRDAGEAVGTYAITQGALAANANYTLNYTGADLTISKTALAVTAVAKGKTYGEADPALTYTVSGLVSGDAETDVLSGALSRDAGEAVGTYAITKGTLAVNDNYTLNYTGTNLTISAAVLTVAADAKGKTYGEADPALTYTVNGLVNDEAETDVLSGALSRDAGESVGTYAITQGTLAVNANYTLSFTSANLTISKADQTITFSSTPPQHVSDTVELEATALSGLPVAFSVIDELGVLNENTLSFTDVGGVTVVALQAGNENWHAAVPVTNTVFVYTVTPSKGPLTGGNTITVASGNFGTITNVLVGSSDVGFKPAILGASGGTWFSLVIPGVSAAELVDIVIQTSDNGDFTLANAYTYLALDPPVALAATQIMPNAFRANWSVVTNAASYVIDVSTTSDFTSFVTGYENRNVGNTAGTWITGLADNTWYWYRVRSATADDIQSLDSNVIAVPTGDDIPWVTVSNMNGSASGGGTQEFALGLIFAGKGLTYGVISDAPAVASASINTITGDLRLTYGQSGTATITVTATHTDTGYAVSYSFIVTVVDAPDYAVGVLTSSSSETAQIVSITNNTLQTASGVMVIVGNLDNPAYVLNGTSVNGNGDVVIEHPQTMPPGATAQVKVVYARAYGNQMVQNPATISAYLVLTPLQAPPPDTATPSAVQHIWPRADGTVVIAFETVPGTEYMVQYRDSLSGDWQNAYPCIRATGTVTYWTDSGQPTTDPHPADVSGRFYRVLTFPTSN